MAKSLIVCCDGTWNTADQKGGPTNVAKMSRAILPKKPDGSVQIVYYDKGVGTGDGWDRFVGGTLGVGLSKNVQEAYRFLSDNYQPGDAILMFGFSRGAYTVRSLAGLVGLVGLLRKGDIDKLPKVWDYYRTPHGKRDAGAIDDAWFSHEPVIDFLGVWDTVGALGVPAGPLRGIGKKMYSFHNVDLSAKVKRGYQALAIDEHRRNFEPSIWNTKNLAAGQVVEQRWFAGAHSNVGGGYEESTLSDAAFLWMCDKARPLLALDEDYVKARTRAMSQEVVTGSLVNSWAKLPWRLLPRLVRKIGGDPSEDLHPSVRWRYDAAEPWKYDPTPYRPKNLTEYLATRRPG